MKNNNSYHKNLLGGSPKQSTITGSFWLFDETINKTYAEYKQCELNENGEKTGKALGNHVINLYLVGISRWLKINDVKKSRQDIENDPIIKDQMAGLGCLFVCTFGNYLAPVLISAHTVNNQQSWP